MTPEQIYNLFIHRKDVFAEQKNKGMYIPTKRPITLQDIQEHLNGEKTIGVYCLNTDNTIKWACVDIDSSDLDFAKAEGKLIYKQFPEFKRMFEFSGRRGYHIWIFFDTPINATLGQRIVKARLNRIGMLKHEVFPKQTELNENRKYGNLVKLPLAIHRVSGKRSEILKMEGFENV
jgi:hypothetical protein